MDNGAEINGADHYGETALIKASGAGHEKVVRLLLNRGAEINARNGRGNSSLAKAVSEGHVKIVEMLLYRGAALTQTAVF